MKGFRATVLAALGCAALTGCGSHGDRIPSLAGLPLAPRAHVTVEHRVCDQGANAYCVLQLVVVGDSYRTPLSLLGAERQLLRHRGWTQANAPVGQELAADSPRNGLRVTYATASRDLEAVDLGWIKRSRPVTLALSRTLIGHTSALSILLQVGTG